MKNSVKRLLNALLLLLAMPIMHLGAKNGEMTLNFDRLFPVTPYKTVLDTCMQVCGEFDAWAAREYSAHDNELFADIIIGKLFHAYECVESMLHKTAGIPPEDAEYLVSVIEKMQKEFKKMLVPKTPRAKNARIMCLLDSIKTKIKRMPAA